MRVDGVVEGVVETIGFRSTLIRRFDKAPVYVPNTALSDHAVTNFTQMTCRRINWTIGVEYRTTVAQLRVIRDDIETYLRGSSDIAQPPPPPAAVAYILPWQCLYFLPEPQGHGALRCTRPQVEGSAGSTASAAAGAGADGSSSKRSSMRQSMVVTRSR